jgi:hypothetical protein
MFFVLVMSVSAVIGAAIAASRGKSVVTWFLLCFFLPLIGHVLLAVLPMQNAVAATRQPASQPLPIAHDGGTARQQTASNQFDGMTAFSVEQQWQILVEYDPVLRKGAAELAPFGPEVVRKLRDAFFVLQDRSLIPGIVIRIREKHEAQAAAQAAQDAARTRFAQQLDRQKAVAIAEAPQRATRPRTLTAPQSRTVPRHTSVTQQDLATAVYAGTFRGIHLFQLLDGRTYIDGHMALVSMDAARNLIDQASRTATPTVVEQRYAMS